MYKPQSKFGPGIHTQNMENTVKIREDSEKSLEPKISCNFYKNVVKTFGKPIRHISLPNNVGSCYEKANEEKPLAAEQTAVV